MVARIKKNDNVIVISGKDKGKKGLVIDLSPKNGQVLVKGIAVATRHMKARKQGEMSGIRKEESFIDLSNVMPVCGACDKPCRTNGKVLDSGNRTRICNNCKEIF
jgi:large subunit ribosomal protein L24